MSCKFIWKSIFNKRQICSNIHYCNFCSFSHFSHANKQLISFANIGFVKNSGFALFWDQQRFSTLFDADKSQRYFFFHFAFKMTLSAFNTIASSKVYLFCFYIKNMQISIVYHTIVSVFSHIQKPRSKYHRFLFTKYAKWIYISLVHFIQ